MNFTKYFLCAQSFKLFGSQQTSLHFPVCGQPVHQDTGTQTRTAAFYPQYKKSAAHPGRQLLLKHVEPAMNLIRRGENQLFDSQGLGLGQLHIGASDTICRYFLVPYFRKFHQQYPNVPIKVTNATSLNCVDLLEQGRWI